MISIAIILCVAAISGLLTYGWWVHYRVWILRQELFELRDGLFRDAVRSGFLDAPDYRSLRQTVNITIRLAPLLSWRFLHGADLAEPKVPKDCRAEVREAQIRMAIIVTNHIYRRTLSGRIKFWLLTREDGKRSRQRTLKVEAKRVRKVMWSPGYSIIDHNLPSTC